MKRIPIVQGEYKVVAEPNVMITTLLGSCIAVCLQDRLARIGGMNHFLLGAPSGERPVSDADMQCYGVHAMELLINEMMKRGAVRSRMTAQLYGGANLVSGLGAPIGTSNAAFARTFLEVEGICVGHTDVGGQRARKVEFLPWAGKARSTFVQERLPASSVRAPAVIGGDLELF